MYNEYSWASDKQCYVTTRGTEVTSTKRNELQLWCIILKTTFNLILSFMYITNVIFCINHNAAVIIKTWRSISLNYCHEVESITESRHCEIENLMTTKPASVAKYSYNQNKLRKHKRNSTNHLQQLYKVSSGLT